MCSAPRPPPWNPAWLLMAEDFSRFPGSRALPDRFGHPPWQGGVPPATSHERRSLPHRGKTTLWRVCPDSKCSRGKELHRGCRAGEKKACLDKSDVEVPIC